MSMALAHFAFGSALTVLVVTYLVPNAPYPRVLALVGGGWAMIPDFYWVSPLLRAELASVHDSVLVNVFWFHQALDVLDTGDEKTVAAGMVALLIAATAVAEHRSYRTPAVVRERIEDVTATIEDAVRE